MKRQQATPMALRSIPPVHFEPHQELSCAAMVGSFFVMAIFLVTLLALIGTGPW